MTSQSKSLSRNVPKLPLRKELDVPFSKGFCQEPNDNWEVLAFVVCWKYNGVFMSVHGWVAALRVYRWHACERIHDLVRQLSHDYSQPAAQ